MKTILAKMAGLKRPVTCEWPGNEDGNLGQIAAEFQSNLRLDDRTRLLCLWRYTIFSFSSNPFQKIDFPMNERIDCLQYRLKLERIKSIA